MFNFYAKCPLCGGIHEYFFDTKNLIRYCLGDMINKDDISSYTKEFEVECKTCNNSLIFSIVVEEGTFINILLNATEKEIEATKKIALKSLKLYKERYNSQTRAVRLLGEDIKIIPNQFCAKHKFRIGEFIMFFNKFWRIDESYKVVGIGDHLYERVYKVVSLHDEDERLLVTSIDRFPALREVDWNADYWLTDDEKLRKYKLRPGFSLVMETE